MHTITVFKPNSKQSDKVISSLIGDQCIKQVRKLYGAKAGNVVKRIAGSMKDLKVDLAQTEVDGRRIRLKGFH